ncbi:pc-fam-1 protein [Moniliophthora roreri MCA 2997]|uniref:Pc-fam-1 protein n=2 Tax=Moniliophthora roreri TaxID=221103 RepID=V2WJE9_MONRO|nr:pc-fam-1 protein [Moniliophthora roreri MCA 2997]
MRPQLKAVLLEQTTSMPNTLLPETSIPETSQPETLTPDQLQPETLQPDTSQPDVLPPVITPIPSAALPDTPSAKISSLYPDMKRIATTIRRPYFSQAVTIIRICEWLIRALKQQADQHEADKIIQIGFQSVHTALVAASEFSQSSIVTQVSSHIESELFNTALQSLHTCFISFKKQDDWAQWEQKMKAAQKRDLEHLMLFLKRIEMVLNSLLSNTED